MDEEIDVSEKEPKDETPVSFVESDGETIVTVGDKKESREDDERWKRAEESQNRLAADFADLRVRLAGGSGPAQPGPSAPAADPYKGQEDAISERERALGIQWEAYKRAGKLDDNKLVEFDQKSRELQQERINIATRRAMDSAIPNLVAATQREQFRAEYGDVQGNANANRWARGYYDQLVAQGAPDSPDTVRLAMNAARRQFRIGNYGSAPTDQDRQQYTGFSGNTGRRNVGDKSNVVKMGKAEKSMAMAMYGDRFNGDEKKAYTQWAKGPGVRAQKAMQKARRANAG